MTFGRRIHAAVLGLAVCYLFIGSAVTRSTGALEANAPKVLLGAAGAWLAWACTGKREQKARREEVHEAELAGQENAASAPVLEEVRPASRPLATEPTRPALSPDRLKRRSELAFAGGWSVEAAYWLAIALLRGATDHSERMQDYVAAWLESDCPDEGENVHAGFTSAQGSFGRAVLCLESGVDRALAIARLDQMAKAGNADARDYLETIGIGREGGT